MTERKSLTRRLRRARVESGVLTATSISVISCECVPHSVWVRLHNSDGELFAVASMPIATARRLAAAIEACAAHPAQDPIGDGILEAYH